jgi:hypothetical protein
VLSFGESKPGLSAIVAVLARWPIRVTAQPPVRPDLPAGFDDVDAAILEWIVTESRRERLRPPLH